MNVTFRRMLEADMPAVHQIDHSSFSMPWPERSFRFEVTSNPAARCWVAEAEGHGNSTRSPDSPLGTDVVEIRGNHERHRRFCEVVSAVQQDRRKAMGDREQIPVVKDGATGENRRTFRVLLCATDELKHERTFRG